MPYIETIQRDALDPSLRWLINDLAVEGFTVGQLNYVFSCLVNAYLHNKGLRYAAIAEIQGLYTGALDEFNARVAQVYEAKKIEENGTVWTIMEEPEPNPPDDIEELMIHDSHGNSWMKCFEADCDLHVTGPGRVECEHCSPEDDPDFQRGEQ